MAHEGYRTALWVFPTQRHVAIGVASDGARFLHTGYAFIETTTPAFIGQTSAGYGGIGPVARPAV